MTIPDFVTTIESGAFEYCEDLISISIPNSVTTIGNAAFRYCMNMTSVNFPNSVTTIEDETFMGCYELRNLVVPFGVTSIGAEAFYGSGLRSIELPSSVTSIGREAFLECAYLTNVNIPFGVTNIDNKAFKNCHSLNSVVIPSSVTSIGSYALDGCSRLKQVTSFIEEPFEISSVFPNTYSSINLIVPYGKKTLYESTKGWNSRTKIIEMTESESNSEFVDGSDFIARTSNGIALRYTVISAEDKTCQVSGMLTSNLQSDDVELTIPEDACGLTVTAIGDEAFKGCGLTSLSIPASVESIGEMAFYGNPLTSVNVEEGNPTYWSPDNSNAILTFNENEWGDELVFGCSSTIIPSGVRIIGKLAFAGCPGLTNIVVPYRVNSIGEGAFYDCGDLTSITIPSTVKRIEEYFCDYDNENLSIISCITNPSEVRITRVWDGIIATLYVPKGTKELYEAADGWKKFTNIIEMDETPVFDGESFTAENEDGLKLFYEVTSTEQRTCRLMGFSVWPEENANIALNIPEKANGLKVTTVRPGAFLGCGLTSVSIPAGVTAIGDGAFAGNQLTTIQVDNKNKVYDSRNNCNALIETATGKLIVGCANTVIPNGVKTIGVQAFCGCSDLNSINIPSTVQTIEGSAFQTCGLTSITIPSSVTSLASGAFGGCPLESITVEEDNPAYDSRNGCNAIIETATNTLVAGCRNTVIPNGIEAIGEAAFIGIESLTSISIPKTVVTIGDGAFEDCNGLTSIVIPDGVTAIGGAAFYGCDFTSFTIPATVRSLGPNVCAGKKTVVDEWGIPSFESIDKVISYITNPAEVNMTKKYVDEEFGAVYYSDPRDVFRYCQGTTLYVPKGTKELYETTAGWDVFDNIVEMDCDLIVMEKAMQTYTSSYALDFSTPVEGLKAYTLTAVNDKGKAVLTEVTGAVPAGTGLVLMGTAGEQYAVPCVDGALESGDNLLVGVTADTEIGGNDTDYILKDGKFVKAIAGTLPAGKAYLKIDAASAREVIEIEGATTGIGNAVWAASSEGKVYNLNGQRVSQPMRGLYIVNGKKVIK